MGQTQVDTLQNSVNPISESGTNSNSPHRAARPASLHQTKWWRNKNTRTGTLERITNLQIRANWHATSPLTELIAEEDLTTVINQNWNPLPGSLVKTICRSVTRDATDLTTKRRQNVLPLHTKPTANWAALPNFLPVVPTHQGTHLPHRGHRYARTLKTR
jgi:hypothetical protein